MGSTLGSIMKEKRRALGLSQAFLSEKLGVSVQTISRWETDHGMPDVSQIVPLAKLLSVSTDMLLGMELPEEETIQEAYREIWDMWHSSSLGIDPAMAKKRWDFQKASYEKLKRLAKKYPENSHLLFECALWVVKYLNETYRICEHDPKEINTLCTDAIKLLLAVLEKEKDVNFISEVKVLLSQLYAHMGDREKAFEITKDLPYPDQLSCRYKQAVIFSDHDMQANIARDRFEFGFHSANIGFGSLYTAYSILGGDERKTAIKIKKKHIALIQLYKGTVPDFLYHYHLCEAYGRLAIEYLRDSRFELCLDNIELVCDNCCAIAKLVLDKGNSSGKNTYRNHNGIAIALFGGKTDRKTVVTVLGNYITECQKECADQVSNPIVNSARYQSCISRLNAYLEK
ncbi:MAG: helix-turn-helix transcriptional regulator [Ruminococcaceae bacterium]|nr:helix-turn-helix transcriptional regulator [Oscillospiraceae bacterium]